MVNPTGYTALDLIGFTDKGPYSSSANYVKNDLVHYSGNIWRCLIDDTSGIAPAEGVNWTLFIGEPTNLVERIIAPVETDPATSAWAVGRQIIYNDNLYEVITAISVGDALVAYEDDPTNANIKLADPVETQLLNEEAARAAADLALQNALSHRNLLDNAWFTVNQRGQSSYTAAGYTVDRWKTVNSVGTMTVNVGGNGQLEITASSDVNDNAFIEPTAFGGGNDLNGKVVTLSLHDGNKVYSITGQIPSTRTSSWQSIGYLTTDDNVTCEYLLPPSSVAISGQVVIRVPKDGVARKIRAVKLELGSISTLAMDTVPNYAEELLKCQRYFQRIKIKANYAMLGLARAVSATSAQSFITPSVPLRAFPSLTVGNISSLSFFANSTSYSISNIVMGTGSYNNSDVVGFQLQFTSSGLTTDDLLSFAGNNAVSSNAPYLDFSADI